MKENLQTKFDNFESRYDFSATEWQGLEARLNQHDMWRRTAWALLGGVLLLGLVGSNILLWRQNQALNQTLIERFSALDSTQSTIEKAPFSPILTKTDTIVKRTIIYQFDTIYRKTTLVQDVFVPTQISSKSIGDKSNFPTQFSTTTTTTTILPTVPTTNLDNNHTTNSSKKDQNTTTNTPQYLKEKTLENAEKSATNTPQYLGEKTLENAEKSAMNTPQYLKEKTLENAQNQANFIQSQTILNKADAPHAAETPLQKQEITVVDSVQKQQIAVVRKTTTKDSITVKTPLLDSLDIVKKDNKNEEKVADKTATSHPKYTFKMLPTYVGMMLGLPIWSKPMTIGQRTNTYGLKAEFVATERVRFMTEINYTKNSESKSNDLATLPNEVALPSVEPNLKLKYWEIYGLKSINYLVGIQYQLIKNSTLRPYVAAAFNGTTTLPFEVDFEYIDIRTGMEKGLKKQLTNKITHLNRFYTAVGAYWQPFPRGQIAAETYLTTPLNGDKTLTPTQLGLKIGLFYLIKN